MKPLLILFASIILISCHKKVDLSLGKTWYPIKAISSDFPNSYRLHAMTFTNDSLRISTLGTTYAKNWNYVLNDNSLKIYLEDDSIVCEVKRNGENLMIRFDSVTAVKYTLSIGSPHKENLSERLKTLLLAKSWMLNDSVMLKCQNQLDYRITHPKYHDHLKNVDIHEKKNNYFDQHYTAAWSATAYEGYNILSIVDLVDDTGSEYFIVNSVSDTLITGYHFDRYGQRQEFKLFAIPKNENTAVLLPGRWQLQSFEEVKNASGLDEIEIWSVPYGNEKGINLSDLQNNALSIVFSKNGRFNYSSNDNIISTGTWNLDETGKLLKLRAEYDDGSITTFQTIIEIDSTSMVVFKKEDMIIGHLEFEVKKYIEVFRKIQ